MTRKMSLQKRSSPGVLGAVSTFKGHRMSQRSNASDGAKQRYLTGRRSLFTRTRLGLSEPTEEDKWRIMSSRNNFKSILMKKKLVRHGVLMKNNMTAYRRHFSPSAATQNKQKEQKQVYPNPKVQGIFDQKPPASMSHEISHTSYVLQKKQPAPIPHQNHHTLHRKSQQKYTQQNGSIKDYIPPPETHSAIANHLSLFGTDDDDADDSTDTESKASSDDGLSNSNLKNSIHPFLEAFDDERSSKTNSRPLVKSFTSDDESTKPYDPLDRLSKNPSGFASLELFSADDDEKSPSEKSASEKALLGKSSLSKAPSDSSSTPRKPVLDEDNSDKRRMSSAHISKYAAIHDDDEDEHKINKLFVLNKTQDSPLKDAIAPLSEAIKSFKESISPITVPSNVHTPATKDHTDTVTGEAGNKVSLLKASKGLFRMNENKGDDDDDDVGDVVATVSFGKKTTPQAETSSFTTKEKSTTQKEGISATNKEKSTRKEDTTPFVIKEKSSEKDETPPAVLKEILKDVSTTTSKTSPIVIDEETEALPPTTNDKLSPVVYGEGSHVIQSAFNQKLSPAENEHTTDGKIVPNNLGEGTQTFSSSSSKDKSSPTTKSSYTLLGEGTSASSKILPVSSGLNAAQTVSPIVLNGGGQVIPSAMNTPLILGGGGGQGIPSPLMVSGGNQIAQPGNLQPIVIEGPPPMAVPGQPTILRPVVFKEGSKLSTAWIPSNFQSLFLNQSPSFVNSGGALTSTAIVVNTATDNKTSSDIGKEANKSNKSNSSASSAQKQSAKPEAISKNILKSEHVQFTPDVQSNYSRFLGITEETSPVKVDNYTNEFDLQFSKASQKNYTRFIGVPMVKEDERPIAAVKTINTSAPAAKTASSSNSTRTQTPAKDTAKNTTKSTPSIFMKGPPKLDSPLNAPNVSKVIVKNESVQFTPDVQSNYGRFLGLGETVEPLKADNYTNEKDISFTKGSQRNYTRFLGIPDPTPTPTPPTAPAPVKSNTKTTEKEAKPMLDSKKVNSKNANITKIVSGSSVVVIPVVPVNRLMPMQQMMLMKPQTTQIMMAPQTAQTMMAPQTVQTVMAPMTQQTFLTTTQTVQTPQKQIVVKEESANKTEKNATKAPSEESGEAIISQELSALGQRKKHKEVLNNKVDDELTKTKLVHDRNGIEGNVFYNELSEKMSMLGPPDHKNYFINKEKDDGDNKAQVNPGLRVETEDSIKNKDDNENIERFLEWEKFNSLSSLHNQSSDSADDDDSHDSIVSLANYGKLASEKVKSTAEDTSGANTNDDPIQSLARLASLAGSQSSNATTVGARYASDQESLARFQPTWIDTENKMSKKSENKTVGRLAPAQASEADQKIEEDTREYSKILASVAKGMGTNETDNANRNINLTRFSQGGLVNPIRPASLQSDRNDDSLSADKESIANSSRAQSSDLQMFSSDDESVSPVVTKENATNKVKDYRNSRLNTNASAIQSNQKSQSSLTEKTHSRQADYDIIKDIASSLRYPQNSSNSRNGTSQSLNNTRKADSQAIDNSQSEMGSAEDTFFKNYANFLRVKPKNTKQEDDSLFESKNEDPKQEYASSPVFPPSIDSLSSFGFNFGGENVDDVAVQDGPENEKDLENVHALYSLHSFLSKLGSFVRKLRRFKKKMHSFCAPLANFCATLAGLPPRFPRLWRVLCGPITKTCAPFGHLYDNLHAFARALRSTHTNQTMIR